MDSCMHPADVEWINERLAELSVDPDRVEFSTDNRTVRLVYDMTPEDDDGD